MMCSHLDIKSNKDTHIFNILSIENCVLYTQNFLFKIKAAEVWMACPALALQTEIFWLYNLSGF